MNLCRKITIELPFHNFSVASQELIDCVRFQSNVGGGMGGGTQVNFGQIIETEHDRILINNVIKNVEMYVYRNAMVSQYPTKLLKVVYKTQRGTQVRFYKQDCGTELVLSNQVDNTLSSVETEAKKVCVETLYFD